MDLEEFISRAEAEAEPGWTRSASLPSLASRLSLYLNLPRHSNVHGVNGDGVGKTIFSYAIEVQCVYTKLPMAPSTEAGAVIRRLRGRQQCRTSEGR
jgi:hypothetical protein